MSDLVALVTCPRTGMQELRKRLPGTIEQHQIRRGGLQIAIFHRKHPTAERLRQLFDEADWSAFVKVAQQQQDLPALHRAALRSLRPHARFPSVGGGSFGILLNFEPGVVSKAEAASYKGRMMESVNLQELGQHVIRGYVHAVFHLDGKLALELNMMEEAERDCASLVERAGPLAPEEIIDILLQVVRGLVSLYVHKLFHRDLKGQNIVISEGGTVKLTDFGLASPFDAANGSAVGTAPANSVSPLLNDLNGLLHVFVHLCSVEITAPAARDLRGMALDASKERLIGALEAVLAVAHGVERQFPFSLVPIVQVAEDVVTAVLGMRKAITDEERLEALKGLERALEECAAKAGVRVREPVRKALERARGMFYESP